MDKTRAEQILADSGALLTGHFILTSGRHSDKYMQCAKILQRPDLSAEMCADLAERFKEDSVDAVVAPAIGGIIVGYEIARRLGALSLFTERENGVMLFRRGFSLPSGARVLVAEDVVTTGGSVFETMERVRKSGGVVIGVAALVDRSGGGVDFGVKTAAAYATEIISYPPDECPLCKAGAPAAVKPGSRAAADFRAPFLER